MAFEDDISKCAELKQQVSQMIWIVQHIHCEQANTQTDTHSDVRIQAETLTMTETDRWRDKQRH